MKKLLVSVIALLATVSLSAQDLTAVYNEAAAAFGNKDFAGAAAKFEEVIDKGMDDETAASLVATAKTTLPKCYFMLGGSALKTKNYEEALKNFTKSAELSTIRITRPLRRFSPRVTPPTPTIRAWRSIWR